MAAANDSKKIRSSSGAPTTKRSVSAGVPMVTWPLFHEQFINAEMVMEIAIKEAPISSLYSMEALVLTLSHQSLLSSSFDCSAIADNTSPSSRSSSMPLIERATPGSGAARSSLQLNPRLRHALRHLAWAQGNAEKGMHLYRRACTREKKTQGPSHASEMTAEEKAAMALEMQILGVFMEFDNQMVVWMSMRRQESKWRHHLLVYFLFVRTVRGRKAKGMNATSQAS
ncbi:uncharacterized protein A4U43_C08F28990 [Asparagus officinalis]|nr:uncharacterized protein A4U43_C08F28990 [Asparagus officinalis]